MKHPTSSFLFFACFFQVTLFLGRFFLEGCLFGVGVFWSGVFLLGGFFLRASFLGVIFVGGVFFGMI